MSALPKCDAIVNRPKPGGMKDLRPCGKPASIRIGKRRLCAEHAIEEKR